MWLFSPFSRLNMNNPHVETEVEEDVDKVKFDLFNLLLIIFNGLTDLSHS